MLTIWNSLARDNIDNYRTPVCYFLVYGASYLTICWQALQRTQYRMLLLTVRKCSVCP